MSMLEEMRQMYLTIQALSVVALESHGGVSEATQNLEHQIFVLDEMFKPFEITTEMVRELRNHTGEGMMSCKKALEKARGNMTFAADIMRSSGNIGHMSDSHWKR